MKRYYIRPGEQIGEECNESPDGDWVKFEDVRVFCDDVLDIIAKGTCNRSRYKLWEEKIVEILKSIRDKKC